MKSRKPQTNTAKRRKIDNKQQTLKKLWAPPPAPVEPPPPAPPPPVPGTRQTGLMGFFGGQKTTEFVSNTKMEKVRKEISKSLAKKPPNKLQEVDVNNVALTDENFIQYLSDFEKDDRVAALISLRNEYIKNRYSYYSKRLTSSNLCYDAGATDSTIMIIRKMPTRADEEARKPCADLRERLNAAAATLNVNLDKYGYFTNLIKVRTKGGKPATYEDIEDHIPFLRQQIRLIKPKVIVAIGAEVATVLRQHLTIDDTNKGRKNWDGTNSFRSDNIWRLRKDYQHITTVSIEEDNFLARLHLLQDPADFQLIYKEKAEREFTEDFIHALQATYFPRLKVQTPEAEFNESLLNKGYGDMATYGASLGVKLSEPTDLFFDRARLYDMPRPECYHSYLKEQNKPFKVLIQMIRYDEYSNLYYLFGRTEEGFLTCSHVTEPSYLMWIKHKSFNPQPDQNRQVNFVLPDLDELYGRVIDLLYPEVTKFAGKYGGLSREMFCRRIGVRFSWSSQRPHRKFHPYTKNYLQIEFREHDVKDKIVRILEAILTNSQSQECRLTALERFFYHTKAYSHGWIEVANDCVKPVEDKHTTCDYEFTFKTEHVVGYKPYEGQYSAMAKFVTADFDLEMKGQNGRFPISQQDPIIRIGALIQEYGDAKRPIQLEYLRDPKAPTQVYPTGRSNYLEKAMFVLGVHKPLTARPFQQNTLPMVPKFPMMAPLTFEEIHTEIGQRLLGEWNDFLTNLKVWQGRVGIVRARATLRSATLQLHLLNQPAPLTAEQRKSPELVEQWKAQFLSGKTLTTLTKDESFDAELYNHWKECIAGVRDYWHQVITLEEFDNLDLEYPDRNIETIGSIQYNWHVFNPAPKTFFFENEKKLLTGFSEYLRQAGVDLLRGHNIANFDIPYLQQRIQVLNLRYGDYFDDRINARISLGRCNFSRRFAIPSLRNDTCSQKIMVTRAANEVKYVIPDIPGVDWLDTLTWARKEIGGLKYHTLSYVAKKLVKDQKFDVPGSSIAHLFTNDPRRLSDYCDQDVELTCRISNARNSTPFTILCSRIIGAMQINELYTTGVQRKIHHILIRYFREEGLKKIVSDKNPFSQDQEIEVDWEEDEIEEDGSTVKKKKRGNKGYQGATCIQPKVGLLILLWLCWDFSSLYPTIMISHGLSLDLMGTLSRFKKLGIPPERLWSSQEKFPNYKTGKDEEWYFIQKRKLSEEEASKLEAYDDQPAGLAQCVKNPDGTYTPRIEVGGLVGVLIFILAQRSAVNARKSTYLSTSIEYAVLDCQQLALKIYANSTYGFTGCKTGTYAAVPIGAGVTFVGRKTLAMICDKMDAVRPGELGGGDTDSIFRSDDYIDDPNKIFAPVWMHEKLEDPTTPLVEKPWVEHIQNYLNRFVPPPMKIVFEKAFWPMFMVAKKRGLVGILMPFKNKFTGKMCFESVKPKFSVKGVETTRRDQLPITQRIMKNFLRFFLITKEEERAPAIKKAVEYVAAEIRKLHAGEYDIYELVETRYYGKSNPKQHTAMVELCDRKRRRGDPAPDLGTRQAFIVVEGDKKQGVNKRVEDPVYVIEHQLQPDLEYVTKKICKPIMRFAQHLGDAKALQRAMFPNFIKNKKRFIQADNPLLSQMYVKHKCEFCGENANRDRICSVCLTSETPEFVRRTVRQKLDIKFEVDECELCHEKTDQLRFNSAKQAACANCYIPEQCDLCGEPSSEQLCLTCSTSNTPEVVNRVLYGKRQRLEQEYEESAKHCYPCLSIEPGDKVECHNFTCNKYFKRVAATIRLNQFSELESEILSKL